MLAFTCCNMPVMSVALIGSSSDGSNMAGRGFATKHLAVRLVVGLVTITKREEAYCAKHVRKWIRPFSVIRVSALDAKPLALMKEFQDDVKAAVVTTGGRPVKVRVRLAFAMRFSPDSTWERAVKTELEMFPV